jgi:hypothetical protein
MHLLVVMLHDTCTKWFVRAFAQAARQNADDAGRGMLSCIVLLCYMCVQFCCCVILIVFSGAAGQGADAAGAAGGVRLCFL